MIMSLFHVSRANYKRQSQSAIIFNTRRHRNKEDNNHFNMCLW